MLNNTQKMHISEKRIFFGNTEKAFKSKNNKELKRSFWLFAIMGRPSIVKIFSKLAIFAIKIGLPVSPIIKSTIYKQFCAGESLEESQDTVKKLQNVRVGSILDYSVEGKDNIEDFERTKNEVLRIIEIAKNNPAIPYTSIKLTGLTRAYILEKINYEQEFNSTEEVEYEEFIHRLDDIFISAKKNNLSIYIDAEESWLQLAIDKISEEKMRQYNREKAIVLTTLQMYRWDRIDYLKKLIWEARREKFLIGIKLVRGAYMEKENKRAVEMNYKSPIQPDKESTDKDFNTAVDICLENIDIITLCAGTHNEISTLHLVDKMKAIGIQNDHPHVYFSQLYGMSDHITFNLADSGYNVTKYLPYGPVKSTLPYLIRRAEENTAIAGQISRELKLILEERKRRKSVKLLSDGK